MSKRSNDFVDVDTITRVDLLALVVLVLTPVLVPFVILAPVLVPVVVVVPALVPVAILVPVLVPVVTTTILSVVLTSDSSVEVACALLVVI